MMQVMDFLMLYAEELFLLIGGMIVILLLVVLHRIRHIAKLMQEIIGYTKEIAHGLRMHETIIHSKKEEVGQAETEAVPDVQTQARLLSEVLDEVFP